MTPKEYEEKFGCSTVPSTWNCGESNPFYGKTHKEGISKVKSAEYRKAVSDRTKGKKIEELLKNVSLEDYRRRRSESMLGKKNPMYGVKVPESRKKKYSEMFVGENNPNWRGGITSYKYNKKVWTDSLKNKIRNRDNHRCQICNKHQVVLKKKLAVHHIDYDKFNYSFENLISLCNSCHAKTSYNREKYEAELRIKMFSKYGNQQPSQSNVVNIVDWKVQRLGLEETTTNKRPKSAQPHKSIG